MSGAKLSNTSPSHLIASPQPKPDVAGIPGPARGVKADVVVRGMVPSWVEEVHGANTVTVYILLSAVLTSALIVIGALIALF